MPTEYVPSGPDIERNGRRITPMAPIYFCEECGFKGAPFGIQSGDEVRSYCGWSGNRPVCAGRGKETSGPE